LRIAVSSGAPDGTNVAPECVAAVEEAANLCRSLGHHVEEISSPIDGPGFRAALSNFWPMTVTRGLVALAEHRGTDPDVLVRDLEPFNQYLFSRGINRRAVDYIQDLVRFQGMARVFGHFFEKYDIWLSPTLPFAPPKLGYFDAGTLGGEEAWQRVLDSFAFTAPANVTGLPSASIPMSWTGDNLPIGVQLTARLNDEASLFNLAGQMEIAKPWSGRRPEL
jgi:amidase